MTKYQATTHATYNIGYHIVFCPKYRYSLLRYRAGEELKRLDTYRKRPWCIISNNKNQKPFHLPVETGQNSRA